MNMMDRVFDCILLCAIVLLVSCGYVFVGAGVSMILCNGILSIFDCGPLTFKQGCGIGVILLLVVASRFYYDEMKEQS